MATILIAIHALEIENNKIHYQFIHPSKEKLRNILALELNGPSAKHLLSDLFVQ